MANKELITAANWRIHPNNQWSFQNIEKLFATEVIKKNHKKQSVFSSNLSKIDAIEFVNLEEKVELSDIIFTAEGKLDYQSLNGKVPIEL